MTALQDAIVQGGIMFYRVERSHRNSVRGLPPFLLGLALLFLSQNALAEFEFEPKDLSLSAREPTALVRVTNTGDRETTVQFDVADWSQTGGRDRLSPSRRLIVAHPRIKLAPGASRQVRVGLRLSGPRWQEESYRLLLRELPPPPDMGEAVTQAPVVRQASMPVFVQPPLPARPRLHWAMEPAGNGYVQLRVSNSSAAHVQLHRMRLLGPDGMTIESRDLPAYVLNGENRVWMLAGDALPGSRWQIIADTDSGPLATDLVVRAN